MIKRFTDTDIWDDPWFQDLEPEYKLKKRPKVITIDAEDYRLKNRGGLNEH